MTTDLESMLAQLTDVSEGEVVTHALSRDVTLPLGAGTMALITLDNGLDHTRPNSLGPAGLAELNQAIDTALSRDEVVAIGVTGKPFILAAGADLSQIGRVRSAEDARTIARIGHAVLRKLGDGDKPSFAFINGAALGGGLEIALHCHYRTVLDSVTAIGMPEVFLGILPGWGGNYLLPRLIGPEAAVKLMIENPLNQNTMTSGRAAYELGLADAIFTGVDFLERSLLFAARVITGTEEPRRPDLTTDAGAWAAAVSRGRAVADAKVHGAAPAAYRALGLVAAARTSDADSAFAAEDEALADLVMSPEFRSGLYAFDLVQKRARRPVGAPDHSLARPVTKVGIVGAGLMAGQLALLFVRRLKVPVVMTDLDQDRVDRGVEQVHREIEAQRAKGKLGRDEANRLASLVTGTTDRAAFADADLVIEAVFEELKVKQQVFAELEQVVRADAVLATNTSSLSVSEMAAALQHPERVVGIHFFNPVAVLPLVEVIRAQHTDDATLATAFEVAKGLKKSAVLVKDAPAFVVNRVLARFLGEITQALDNGTPAEVADHALDELGLPMTPFTLLQLVGPAVALHVAETMHEAFPDRFGVSENLARLVQAKRPGIWSFDDRGRPYLSDEVRDLLVRGDRPESADQVRDRALEAVADEISRMLDEGVVAAAADVDLCLLLGAGWPFHLGGITPYLDRTGISRRVTGRLFRER